MSAFDRITLALCAIISAGSYGRILLEDKNFSVVGIGVIGFLFVMAVRQIWKAIGGECAPTVTQNQTPGTPEEHHG